jgi:hypothetical protein
MQEMERDKTMIEGEREQERERETKRERKKECPEQRGTQGVNEGGLWGGGHALGGGEERKSKRWVRPLLLLILQYLHLLLAASLLLLLLNYLHVTARCTFTAAVTRCTFLLLLTRDTFYYGAPCATRISKRWIKWLTGKGGSDMRLESSGSREVECR